MGKKSAAVGLVTAFLLVVLWVPGARSASYGPSWNQFRYDECPRPLQNLRWRDYHPPSDTGIGDYNASAAQGRVDVCYDEYLADRAPGAVYDVWVVVLRTRNQGAVNSWNREERNGHYRIGVAPYANALAVSAYSGNFSKASCREYGIPLGVGYGAYQVGTTVRLTSCTPLTQTSVAWGGRGRAFTINAVAGVVESEHAMIVKSPIGKRPLFNVSVELPYGTRSHTDSPLGRVYRERMSRIGVTTQI